MQPSGIGSIFDSPSPITIFFHSSPWGWLGSWCIGNGGLCEPETKSTIGRHDSGPEFSDLGVAALCRKHQAPLLLFVRLVAPRSKPPRIRLARARNLPDTPSASSDLVHVR